MRLAYAVSDPGTFTRTQAMDAATIDIHTLPLLSVGFALGLKHALDADHILAVSTIVSERKGFFGSALVGAFWGIGHTFALMIAGLVVVILGVQIPSVAALWMEFAVALMLVALGANVLWKISKGARFHFHAHQHDHHVHIHPHLHKPLAAAEHHKMMGHHHHIVKAGKKPFFIGMMHGMAGSAALMLIVLSTISSHPLALLYIGTFGLGSVGGMVLMSVLIGLPFSFAATHEKLSTAVRTAAGVLSVCFGLILALQIVTLGGLFL